MITIYKSTPEGLQTLKSTSNGCWIKAIDPTEEEISQLEKWGIAPELITYSLDLDEMARVERDDGYTLILLRIPHFQGETHDIPYTTTPIGIIIKDNLIATICRHDSHVIRMLINGKYRGFKTAKRYRFVLYVLLETATRYLTYLREINRSVDKVEDQLQKSTRNRELLELLKFQKSLVYFTTALRSNEVMMERLQRMRMFNQYAEDEDLLEDVRTENQQAIQTTNIQTEILSSTLDTFASIISNNLNAVLKVLTTLTIVVSLPTLVASFFGMNVSLPGEGHPLAFLGIFGFSLLLISIAVFIFFKRDWL
ncbi:MAG: magnesium transporter CorA family protein [Anaerolineae bacterium]|nr:magnesium transporter CorA family protein [Anaerolineae bacterium]MDK1118005.1 magnesium transporter CorA family protein [Anaerolineae bacterium]